MARNTGVSCRDPSHPTGGINALFADGSTRFIKNSISLSVYESIASINAGEVISADSY